MINHELRSQGIGASEVAAIIGLDPRRDAFAVWARKLKLVDEPESNIRMRKGKFFEAGIAEWYSQETGNHIQWFDRTIQHVTRSWQVCTPDAWVVSKDEARDAIGGVDAKLVSFDQRDHWGDAGTVAVPDHYAIQCQWTCSACDLPWWDIAAAIGDELRIYRIHRDPAIEAVLLEVVEKFWQENVIGRTQPPIGATDTAKEYIKKRFPKHKTPLRVATPEEAELMAKFKEVYEEWDAMEKKYGPIENEIRLAIGEAQGIINGPWRITFTKDRDSYGTNWQEVAEHLEKRLSVIKKAVAGTKGSLPDWWDETFEQLTAKHQMVTRHGPRKLRPTFGKKR